MKVFAMGASLATLAAADKPDYAAMWIKFKSDYNKDYSGNGEDEQAKFQVFKQNVDIIEEHNAKKLSYWLGVNEFADLTWDEFSSTHLGYKSSGSSSGLTKVPFPNITDVADSIDWVAKGAVTKVKNQEQCGSCWAFSSTGSLEGAMFVSTGELISLSEEDLVQCNSKTDHGCQGGLMDNAFDWVQKNGICSESWYPYSSGGGVTGTCKKGRLPEVIITGHTDVPSKDESALKAAVSKQPVSVAIEADQGAFQHYAGGVLDNSACGTNLDHGVLVVGYGTDGKDYWKVKNSWGASWGEDGYIRMVRNKNQCGISQQASYPIGAKAAPPGPTPSPSSHPHYGNLPCRNDETSIGLQRTQTCTTTCDSTSDCPSDTPKHTKAKPKCVGDHGGFCLLSCKKDSECPKDATCVHNGDDHQCMYSKMSHQDSVDESVQVV